jgi:hypothetical protein
MYYRLYIAFCGYLFNMYRNNIKAMHLKPYCSFNSQFVKNKCVEKKEHNV